MSTRRVKNQRNFCYLLLASFITLSIVSVVQALPLPQDEAEVVEVVEVVDAVPEDANASAATEVAVPATTTSKHFLKYLFEREGNRNPWLAQLVESTVPVLAQEGIGGVIKQSFKAGPALAVGAFNALANFRIGPLLNLPAIPTTTLIPPHKRYRVSEGDSQ